MRFVSLLLVLLVLAGPAEACVGLRPPVDGPIVAPFAPRGTYAGHWGIDLAAPEGSPVLAAGAGTISFAGTVAGMVAVTVDHGGGLRSTVSYLRDEEAARGSKVVTGSRLGTSGLHADRPSVHFSTRIDGRYVDPVGLLGCAVLAPAGAVRLVPLP